MTSNVIPGPVPIPLPAPVWLIHLLQVFTFVLHLVFMNLLVGGTVLLTVCSYRGRSEARYRDLTRRASRALPPIMAFTITLGVAPLLFLQLVYGQYFYTSSVLMAWLWLAVVLLVMLAYYGIYWFSMQHEELGPRRFWVMLATTLLILHVMKTFTQNMILLERPQDFYPRFFTTTVGNFLGPHDLLVFVRLSHFFLAALALGGLGLAILSRSWRADSPDLADWARRYGTRWFQVGTGLQFIVGPWFLFSQNPNMRRAFLGGDRLDTSLLAVAIILAILAMAAARKSPAVSVFAIVGTISLMAVIRHLFRLAYLDPHFEALPVQGQWVVFAIFVVLLLAGLATIGWMLYRLFRPAPARTASV